MLWIVGTLLLILDLPIIKGVLLSPCGSEGVQEVLAGHETRFTCTSEGPVEWRLHYYDWRTKGENRMTSAVLATGDMFVLMNSFDGLFTAAVINNNTTSIIVNTVNNTRLYNNVHFLNGSLECTRRDADNMSAGCGLDYVDPPKNISCTAVNSSFSVHVSCVIGSVYSSRRRYKCQLIRSKNASENKTLETVTMRPKSPIVSCSPQPHVLENTNVTCTCKAASVGQPAGYLAWVADAPKTSRIFLNGRERHVTVMEKDQVHLRCESDGRPTPNISIYNNDNDRVIFRGSSVINYTFIARCEDTATYTCSAWNEFSHHVTTSLSIQLDTGCKPRSVSSTNVINIYVKHERDELTFDVIAFPVPSGAGVWLAKPLNHSSIFSYVQISDANVSCKSDIEEDTVLPQNNFFMLVTLAGVVILASVLIVVIRNKIKEEQGRKEQKCLGHQRSHIMFITLDSGANVNRLLFGNGDNYLG
ncbi:hypothetical protein C0Q70_12304 [Pomacea canaliculata]|uniref:Ig-like domain-containing protein n=1 Tax=Pomacea canaliculata TaxID=400727 RepID=A0A2T7P153_POMCA|nr:hypothetical protein C0Q70_12304 [Pomacea canaliculata]